MPDSRAWPIIKRAELAAQRARVCERGNTSSQSAQCCADAIRSGRAEQRGVRIIAKGTDGFVSSARRHCGGSRFSQFHKACANSDALGNTPQLYTGLLVPPKRALLIGSVHRLHWARCAIRRTTSRQGSDDRLHGRGSTRHRDHW